MKKEIYFAGGCFWGVEKFFSFVNGVVDTKVGYANGNKENPTYEEVCKKETGFAETVKVTYDEKVITLTELLKLFFAIIDPTSLNKQGNDIGTQYRVGIYSVDNEDHTIIAKELMELAKKYDKEIVVENEDLKNFYLAEEYHQHYLDKNQNGYCHISFDKFELAKNKK